MVAEGCTFRLGKGFVFPALQALCALGMLGIRNGTYLAHHLQGFPVVPVFDDLPPEIRSMLIPLTSILLPEGGTPNERQCLESCGFGFSSASRASIVR